MGKKMKLPFPFKNTETWPWPSCGSPKTLSFRAGNELFKTINTAYIESVDTVVPEYSSESRSFLEEYSSGGGGGGESSIEMMVRGLRSERLFFEPAGETNSILEEAKSTDGFPFKETVVMAMESQDPYMDFKRSMEEMVEAHGLKDWECLEELLSWYFRVNGNNNHGYIIGAFVDLLIGTDLPNIASSSSSSSHHDDRFYSTTHSPTSPLSFSSSTSSTSPCLSSLLEAHEDEIEKTVGNGTSSSSDV
uniref:Transcription repressor n=1 Tax=Davidia involucrata TaxID=16924 RepID=A0A5B6YIE4_DAVIN